VRRPAVAVLHHLARPFTGHAGTVLHAARIALDERRVYEGDPLPALDAVEGVLSLGGEQSVTGIGGDPVLSAEAALLRAAVAHGMPVLGVCLGAQLLAHALGGTVAPLPRRRLDWAPIVPTPAASGDPVLGALPARAHALHWNGDGFTLPPGGVELLAPSGGSVEGFRAGASAWGIQFHPEVDAEALEHWYADWPDEPAEAGRTMGEARRADAEHLPCQAELARAVFGGFARVVRARALAAA
jgi:GMP synthase (glutamine-hydrolysing)